MHACYDCASPSSGVRSPNAMKVLVILNDYNKPLLCIYTGMAGDYNVPIALAIGTLNIPL